MLNFYALTNTICLKVHCTKQGKSSLKPSDADISITRKIKEGERHLDISLLDHLILTSDERYYSFAEEGDL